ncbi:hypothetical protein [Piscirickettsia salmonis]|uniref:hypothetical protein n=1 Tax=Piscirickettsia salmonis TaxID=1238 RepID=UPI003A7FE880
MTDQITKAHTMQTTLPRRSLYRHYKETNFQLHQRLLKKFPQDTLHKFAKRFKMVDAHNNVTAKKPDHEDLLIDYCLYHHKVDGQDFINNALKDPRCKWTIEELELLHIMQESQLGLYSVDTVLSRDEALISDLKSGQSMCVTDRKLTQMDLSVRTLIITRLYPLSEFNLTCGSMIPLFGQESIQAERLYQISANFSYDILKLLILEENLNDIIKAHQVSDIDAIA